MIILKVWFYSCVLCFSSFSEEQPSSSSLVTSLARSDRYAPQGHHQLQWLQQDRTGIRDQSTDGSTMGVGTRPAAIGGQPFSHREADCKVRSCLQATRHQLLWDYTGLKCTITAILERALSGIRWFSFLSVLQQMLLACLYLLTLLMMLRRSIKFGPALIFSNFLCS